MQIAGMILGARSRGIT
ncbi:hypothetical protein ACTQWG_01740 [Blautia sp. HCP3S3_H10_1]